MSLSDGSVVEVDSFDARLKRMQSAIHTWVDFITPVSKSEGWDWVMVTLTYKYASHWSPRDITKYTEWLKYHYKKDLHSYCWVAELQERGAVHYHLIACVTKGIKIAYPDKAQGAKGHIPWKHGFTKVEKAEKPAYLVTYVGKAKQKDYFRFPLGARGFGIWLSGHVSEAIKRFQISSKIANQSPIYVRNEVQKRSISFNTAPDLVKKLSGRWMRGSDPLTRANAPPFIQWDDRNRLRFLASIKEQMRFNVGSEPLRLRDLPKSLLQKYDLWYSPGSWIIEGEVLNSGVEVLGYGIKDPSTWVAELMSREPNTNTDFEKIKSINRMAWESVKGV